MNNQPTKETKDVILIGAGIMSATLGTLLKELEPSWNITLFEKLDQAAGESSNEWNNAGTGHEALCELNYTVENEDGSIDTSKAVEINEQFQISKQFWSYLVEKNKIQHPQEFIRALPHISFVQGKDNVDFLKKRFHALSTLPMFTEMEYSEDPQVLSEWIPLMMQHRTTQEAIAGTKVHVGTDVNFGELTRKLIHNLKEQSHVTVRYHHTVTDIERMDDGTWEVKVRNYQDDTLEHHKANFVFIGAGGGAIPLLQKTNIPESKGIGGFPISGEFLVCTNPEIVQQHDAKVYGKEPKGTPPMTVPHLDRRRINNEDSLLFGPFAGFGPKFLKKGSNMDFLRSIKPNNTLTMLAAGAKNMPLINYSIQQLLISKEERMKELRRFVPSAKDEDWELIVAGKRIQVIKDTNEAGKGFIQFGTEIVPSKDRTIAALLGESPGASTSVAIMLDVLKQCFPQYLQSWEPHLKEMIPSYGESLANNTTLLKEIRDSNAATLSLTTGNLL